MNSYQDDDICVKSTLEKILYAQNNVVNRAAADCEVSCEQSIDMLLNPIEEEPKNTIPFMLFCNGCETFKVNGVTTFFDHHSKKEKFYCFTTFIFKIKKLDKNCATLELLTIDPDGKPKHDEHCVCTPCSQLHCENVEDLIATGVCVKIDISCFCGIQCLPAVRL
jgi:hypothetical protein